MPAYEAARLMLGKLLCRRQGETVIRARITETECYYGTDDSASHAYRGRTERNSVMFDEGGRAYVYLCYGMHNLLNVTTGGEGHPEAVLIRGVEGAQGPGRVTRLLGIDRQMNKASVCDPEGDIWLEDDGYIPDVHQAKRVGIDYAQEKDRERLWRFFDAKLAKAKYN